MCFCQLGLIPLSAKKKNAFHQGKPKPQKTYSHKTTKKIFLPPNPFSLFAENALPLHINIKRKSKTPDLAVEKPHSSLDSMKTQYHFQNPDIKPKKASFFLFLSAITEMSSVRSEHWIPFFAETKENVFGNTEKRKIKKILRNIEIKEIKNPTKTGKPQKNAWAFSRWDCKNSQKSSIDWKAAAVNREISRIPEMVFGWSNGYTWKTKISRAKRVDK